MPRKSRKPTKEEFVALFLDKTLTMKEIASRLRVTGETCRRLAAEFGFYGARTDYVTVDRFARSTLPLPPRDEFIDAWFDETLTRADIKDKFGLSKTRCRRIAKEYGLPMERPNFVDTTKSPDPTPEEIEERAAEIRRGWSEAERQRRGIVKAVVLKQTSTRVF